MRIPQLKENLTHSQGFMQTFLCFCLIALCTCFSQLNLPVNLSGGCLVHDRWPPDPQCHTYSSNTYQWESSSLQKYLQTRFEWSYLMLYSLDEERCEVVNVDMSRRLCSTKLILVPKLRCRLAYGAAHITKHGCNMTMLVQRIPQHKPAVSHTTKL